MARKLEEPNSHGGTTDHSEEIAELRDCADRAKAVHLKIELNLAADLLEAHDQTGISLDDWPWARRFVEEYLGINIIPNCV